MDAKFELIRTLRNAAVNLHHRLIADGVDPVELLPPDQIAVKPTSKGASVVFFSDGLPVLASGDLFDHETAEPESKSKKAKTA